MDVCPRLEERLDDRAATHRLRLDVLDVVHHSGHESLVARDDPSFHLWGGKPGVVPTYADHRNVDIGENVGGRALQHDRGHQNDDQCGHNKCVRPVQCDTYDPHGLSLR